MEPIANSFPEFTRPTTKTIDARIWNGQFFRYFIHHLQFSVLPFVVSRPYADKLKQDNLSVRPFRRLENLKILIKCVCRSYIVRQHALIPVGIEHLNFFRGYLAVTFHRLVSNVKENTPFGFCQKFKIHLQPSTSSCSLTCPMAS